MEEMRQLVQEEGREARNVVAFHVPVDTPARVPRKPPRTLPPRRAPPRPAASRLRSASAGRDKRSELRARYWALLFGDLRRSIGEIYNTVETHESLSECQEVILVLENYTRDFMALCEWFRLKWEYDNTPPPQRPQSLAWEIRKTDFVRPESRRAHSVKSSPSVSGKNSPCLSGHNTPSGKNSPNLLTGKISPGSGKISPRVTSGHSITSPKANVEFFSNKTASKITTKPEPKAAKENRLSDIKEKVVLNVPVVTNDDERKVDAEMNEIEIGRAEECANVTPKPVIIKSSPNRGKIDVKPKSNKKSSISAQATVDKLDAMENAFLDKQLTENAAKNDNMLNQDKDSDANTLEAKKYNLDTSGQAKIKTEECPTESPTKSDDNFADISNESSMHDDKMTSSNDEKSTNPSPELGDNVDNAHITEDEEKSNSLKVSEDVANAKEIPPDKTKNTQNIDHSDLPNEEAKNEPELKKTEPTKPARPAYSQAAAKPKLVTAKPEIKSTTKSNTIIRSKTVVEIRPNTAPKMQKPFPKRNQTNKCSYPFNLTTGRTSLFDSGSSNTPNKQGVRKPLNRNLLSASGDIKLKSETKKLTQKRPTTLKINEKGDTQEKLNPQLEKIKNCEEYSSSDTIVTQIDMSRIESSESLRTLVPDDLVANDVANSIEVLNVDGSKNDNEGWLTVKSRRLSRESKKQSKSHWSNRFHQPSATTSLPTLNMIESPKQETKSAADNAKLDRAKSEQPEKVSAPTQDKDVKLSDELQSKPEKSVNTAIIRQKSDVTGLKTRSARNKAFIKKSERMKESRAEEGSELSKNRLHSSLESLTGLSRSQESTEEAFDFDKWKVEFKSYLKYHDDDEDSPTHNEILNSADPSEMSEIAEMTSQIEENERKINLALDFQSECDQRKLCQEEDSLNRQIMELQQVSDADLDTETDETETDAEIPCEDARLRASSPDVQLGALAASLEDQYETALAGMSWAERVDTLVVLEALVARDPGRAQQLHAKLSQGIKRRGSFQDALRRLQTKQARAEQQRSNLQTERTKKIHMLLTRVEEVKVAKNQLIEEKRLRMEKRLQKAAENRNLYLKDRVRKAHDEEEKLREIAFITHLQAEHKRQLFLDQCYYHTARLKQMRRDHLAHLQQHLAAREAAAGARRDALEEARRRRVTSLLQRRRERQDRVDQLKLRQRQERGHAAREKAEGVRSRLRALAAAAARSAAALRSRISDKQDASRRRLACHLQAIRERATAPRLTTTSESQEAAPCEGEELAAQARERRERERQKNLKKRARKLRQKLISAGNEFEQNSAYDIIPLNECQQLYGNNKIYRLLIQVNNVVSPFVQKEYKCEYSFQKQETVNGNPNDGVESNKNNLLNGSADNKISDCNGNTDKKKPKKKKAVKQINDGPDTEANDKSERDSVEKTAETTKKPRSRKKKAVESDNNNSEARITDLINQNEASNNTANNDNGNGNVTNINGTENANGNDRNGNVNDKKPKHGSDKAKLSKSSSVASSTSDMSKLSAKSERKKKQKVDNIDWMQLEKTLNELNRVLERFDRNSLDILIHGIKILSQLLILAVDREETGIQVTTKSLTVAVQMMCRIITSNATAAAYFLNTSSCVHVAKLLSLQLEKDEDTDKSSTALTRQLADCLSLCLDAALTVARDPRDSRDPHDPRDPRDPRDPAALRLLSAGRRNAHMIISYICLSGSVARCEYSEAARESMQALITVCADLCHPSALDGTSQERLTALNCLRTSLHGSLSGARAEFCQLFDRGAALQGNSDATEFVRAARTAHLLSSLAKLDHRIVQDAFSEGRWPLEFRAAVARLLSQHAPNDKETPRQSALRATKRLDQSLSETMVLDLIILVGFVVVNNPQHQETIISGWSAVKTLCTLPANWIVSKPHCKVLLPTLAALAQYPPAAAVIANELSLDMIEEYTNSEEAKDLKLVQIMKEGKQKQGTANKKGNPT